MTVPFSAMGKSFRNPTSGKQAAVIEISDDGMAACSRPTLFLFAGRPCVRLDYGGGRKETWTAEKFEAHWAPTQA